MTRRYPGFDKTAGVYTHPVATAAILSAALLGGFGILGLILLVIGVVYQ